jgi:KRAB domain-containing zinc finger protein
MSRLRQRVFTQGQFVQTYRYYSSQLHAFECDECGKAFGQAGYLRRHVESIHTKIRFTCDVEGCDKSYSFKNGLSMHIKSIHEGDGHRCEQCDKNFSTKQHLTHHTKTVHLSERQFVCSVESCGKSFTYDSNLKAHIKSVHEGVRFPCLICDKSFTRRGSLKTHISSVHELTRHQCINCDKSYTRVGDLNTHIKQKHSTIQTDEIPTTFNCLHCNSTLASFVLLRTHNRVHHPRHVGGLC